MSSKIRLEKVHKSSKEQTLTTQEKTQTLKRYNMKNLKIQKINGKGSRMEKGNSSLWGATKKRYKVGRKK